MAGLKRFEKENGLPGWQGLVWAGGCAVLALAANTDYHAIGVLPKGQLVEVDRSGLVAGFVGQTALKTQEVIQKAIGGVLFVNEPITLRVALSSAAILGGIFFATAFRRG